jgi:DNA-binding NarL/FixJ family response regulator
MAELRVFLADDHAVVRVGLRALIDAQSGITVVGGADDGLTVCQEVPVLCPHVVVMDVSMPGLSGSEATERLRKECPHVIVRPTWVG